MDFTDPSGVNRDYVFMYETLCPRPRSIRGGLGPLAYVAFISRTAGIFTRFEKSDRHNNRLKPRLSENLLSRLIRAEGA